jgi:ubiquinone/menaquinone biosynthesis C-methylase UbiE
MNVMGNDKIFLHRSAKEFERLYIELRNQEKRIYTDEEVAWLPEVDESHIYKREWEIRKRSAKKMMQYLQRKNLPLKILEVGCGNGWFSCQLSQIPYSHITGIDINLLELQQAERVFGHIPNLNFIYGDIDSLEPEKFDVIVFAAAIQYFQAFSEVIETALGLLNNSGEIHIIDSHFYSEAEVKGAKRRSLEYFHKQGFDEMNEFYFHHSLKELKAFDFSVLCDPNAWLHKIFKMKNPFHWIRIKR